MAPGTDRQRKREEEQQPSRERKKKREALEKKKAEIEGGNVQMSQCGSKRGGERRSEMESECVEERGR